MCYGSEKAQNFLQFVNPQNVQPYQLPQSSLTQNTSIMSQSNFNPLNFNYQSSQNQLTNISADKQHEQTIMRTNNLHQSAKQTNQHYSTLF